MSLWSVLGKVGKGIATVGLKTVDVVAGTNTSSILGGGQPAQQSVVTASVAQSPSLGGAGQSVSDTLLSSIKNLFNAGASFLTGQSHAQVDVNTGVGGRANDPTSSGLPSWLMPAALIGGGVLLITTLSKTNKRY